MIPDRGDCSGGSGADSVDSQRKETEPSPKWFSGICEHERDCRESGKKDDAKETDHDKGHSPALAPAFLIFSYMITHFSAS